MYRKADTPYKKIRKRLIGLNDYIGKSTGYKLKRVTYSRPSTLEALKKFGSKEIRAIEIGCAAGNNSLDVFNAFSKFIKNNDLPNIFFKDPDWIISS